MPSFNRRGELCIGLGRFWYDDTRTIAQECSTPLALAHTTTPENPCIIALSDGTWVYSTGTNLLRANGAQMWACVPYPVPGGAVIAYVDALGRSIPDRMPDTIGPDGAVCLRPHSNAFADVLERSGEVWRLTDYDAFEVQLLGNRTAMWRDRRAGYAAPLLGVPIVQPAGEFAATRLVPGPRGLVLLYQSFDFGALVLDGHVVSRGTTFYAPDAFWDGAVWRVAWSTQPQETGVTPPPLVFTDAWLQAQPVPGPTPEPPDPELPEPPDPAPEPPDPEPTPEPPDPEPPHPAESYLKVQPYRIGA